MSVVPGGLWTTLESTPRYGDTNVWQALDERLDIAQRVPTWAPGVEAAELSDRDGRPYYVLRSPGDDYLRLDANDYALWQRMDGRQTVQEIALAHFLERGDFAANRLATLIRELEAGGFLVAGQTDVFASIVAWRRSRKPIVRLARLIKSALVFELYRVPWADELFSTVYRRGGWILYTRAAQVLFLLIIGVGIVVWLRQVYTAEHSLLKTNGSYLLGFITLCVLDVAGVNLHDLAQGLTLKHTRRKINGCGLTLYYLLPVVFLDTTDAWLANRRQRMAVSWSGPCAILVLGCILAVAAAPLDGTEVGALLFKGATIWILNGLFNLLPILDLDGYFLLVDWLEMPALRTNSLRFVRYDLWRKLTSREPLSRDERVLTAFGIGWALLIVLIPLLIIQARDLRYWDTVVEMWNDPEPLVELMAIGLVAVFLGPATASLGRTAFRVVRRLLLVALHKWRQSRGQIPAAHIEALAALPFLRFSRAELMEIAARLSPMWARAGTVLVRQGGAGDDFYLIEHGYVRVVRERADGSADLLARLGPGDHFGETALVERVPRTATVVAETDVDLLLLDGGHFRRWLRDPFAVADAVKRSQAERARLAELPLFRGTSPRELDRLASCMLVTRYAAGDVIVRQGDPGDRFYVISEGEAEVERQTDGSRRSLATLKRGDFFGEMALLSGEPRTATVRAISPIETYTLAPADFQELVAHSPAAPVIRAAAARRRLESIA
jgi:putative peptide zinc metalloprotease protein